MWLVISKTDKTDAFEVPTEREAYEYCKASGFRYYYEFLPQCEYMERKTKEWKKSKRNTF